MDKNRIARNKIEAMLRGAKVMHFGISMLVFILAWIKFCSLNRVFFDYRHSYYIVFLYMIILLFFCRIFNAYSVEYERKGDLIYSQILSEFLSVAVVYFLESIAWQNLYNPMPFVLMLLIKVVLNAIWVLCIRNVLFSFFPKYNTLVIYKEKDDREKVKEIEHYYNYFIIVDEIRNPGSISELKGRIKKVDVVIVAGVNATLRNGIMKQCLDDDIKCFFAPHIGDVIVSAAQYQRAFCSPVMIMSHGNNKLEYLAIKRVFDIFLSLIGLVVFSPIMLITALVIYIYDRESPIYKQTRLTKGERTFVMYKFRSMRGDAESDGVARLTRKNDERITPVGRIIRACRIDELPQLINILRGDMSIVGPRPERPEIANRYEADLPEFKLRLKVKAGLVGYAQVYGKYNTNAYEKLEMDLIYITKMSILTDLELIFATIKILFQKRSTEGFE